MTLDQLVSNVAVSLVKAAEAQKQLEQDTNALERYLTDHPEIPIRVVVAALIKQVIEILSKRQDPQIFIRVGPISEQNKE